MRSNKLLLSSLILLASSNALGHGLMSDPPARNWFCGASTKPDTAEPGSACAEAFADDFTSGYSFMSVLTHDVGRAGVTPLPDNVCGFDSETWQGGATPWDKAIDWPTNPMSSGEQTITWDISWGPHFDDTEEFRYWITKPGFEFQVGQPLTWDDFESQAFCVLEYDDSNPNANPNIVPDKGNALFHTSCDVPERTGRHVIYGEWGRNEYTYERFHGCVDVSFDGDTGPIPVVADITATPDGGTFAGAGSISFDASGSQGDNLSYSWSLNADNDSLYSLSASNGSSTVLTLTEPDAQQTVTVNLQVSNDDATSTTSIDIVHLPSAGANWEDLGPLSNTAQTLAVGDEVSLRLVESNGTDVYLPEQALVLDATNAGASEWPFALAQAVNDENTDVQVGVLNAEGDVVASQSATANRVYAESPANYTSAFLQVSTASSSSSSSSSSSDSSTPSGTACNWYGTTTPLCSNSNEGWGYEDNQSCVGANTCAAQPAPYGIIGGSSSSDASTSSSSSSAAGGGEVSCDYETQNAWGSGFTANITLTNEGDTAVNGWQVQWQYSNAVSIVNSWEADVSGSGPFTASDIGRNSVINPGQSVSFGFQGSGSAETVNVTGDICQ
ncbi:lytic polysaccharide monooxygenase [Gilvimarinus agarilyticus]|uniref:lytic polysaccharide monooxygenase n=1 Tax=Gilvimarinus agarilyticus TaxID=679259 RepID=UPI000695A87B|nr:lytic polysaccharide monooxygenase [Gilvimarinus agarilyticus]